MKLSVMFTCGECGLQTPGIANLPDGVNEKRPVTLTNDCHHCDAEITRDFPSVAALRAEAEQEASA